MFQYNQLNTYISQILTSLSHRQKCHFHYSASYNVRFGNNKDVSKQNSIYLESAVLLSLGVSRVVTCLTAEVLVQCSATLCDPTITCDVAVLCVRWCEWSVMCVRWRIRAVWAMLWLCVRDVLCCDSACVVDILKCVSQLVFGDPDVHDIQMCNCLSLSWKRVWAPFLAGCTFIHEIQPGLHI